MALWGSVVNSVTAGDATITAGGTATDVTMAVNAIAESKVTNLTTDLAARQLGMTIVGPKTSNYTAAANEFVLVDTTSGNVTIAFPTAPANGTRNGVKHTVRGGTNVVNLALGGSDAFNVAGGATTGSVTLLNQGALLQYLSSAAIFATIAGDLPLSQLDTRYMIGSPLATGEEVFSRDLLTSTSIAATSGVMRLSFFTARKTETTTQVRIVNGNTAAGATPTLCRVGLYSVDASDNGTLVASIANDTTLWAATNTAYTRSWTTPYAKVAGQRYAYGQLIVTSFALPAWSAAVAYQNYAQAEVNLVPRVTGAIASLTDLPSSFTVGGLSGGVNRHYGVILP